MVRAWVPIPPVFCRKSAQSIENKGKEIKKERQESSRVCKGLEGKEIEEVEEVRKFRTGGKCEAGAGETKVRRTFTGHDTTDCRSCQYIKWVLVFKDWAQRAATSRRRDRGANETGSRLARILKANAALPTCGIIVGTQVCHFRKLDRAGRALHLGGETSRGGGWLHKGGSRVKPCQA